MTAPYGGPPVVVVGSGPVGQTAALLLARWGVGVVLLDARPARDAAGSRSICQARDVLDIWAAVGAGRQIADEGVTWRTARTFYRDHELSAWSFVDRAASPLPPMVNISQARTEQILAARLAAAPLVAQRWSHEVTDLRQDADGVTVHCATPAGPATLRTPYVVLAAGARCRDLRARLGVRFDGRSYDDRFLICDIRADLPDWERERRFFFDPPGNPGRQVLVHPCPGRTFRVDWQVPAGFALAAEAASGGLDARVRAVVGRVPYEIRWQTVYRFHARRADRMRVDRVLLAGDCAHLVAPFGARGLNSGVPDAENAAWKLAFVLRGWAPPELLESYHAERHAAAGENLDVTAETMRFLVPHGPAETARRRDLLERAVHDPGARASIDSGRFAEPYWYVDSPLTTPDPGRPFPGRPPRGHCPAPAPGILVPDVPLGRGWLRERVRDGLLVLCADGAPEVAAALAGVPAPVRVVQLSRADPRGRVAAAWGMRPGEAWVVRPDGHLAATLAAPTPGAVRAALDRARGVPAVGSG
ncbi:FAD-dependent oxidoreductase [Pilimelia terevasa]|uniref:FAD-dependent oxidoreductase n=1 Tax=Pilimelia terevasa TaxID=53372 RepID=A0A8J3BQ59_9ACTN|nr:FAD-dependent monooxygenase [Pilimelia terevasa]GGK40026.1 FAD-dependent oxidoreductase [Pilimelia terevasa]